MREYNEMTDEFRPSDAKRDERFVALSRGIGQLDNESLNRLHSHIENELPLVLDSVHYEPNTGTWCALAVALDVPLEVAARKDLEAADLTEDEVVSLITEVGIRKIGRFSINPTSGVDGTFYTDNRYSDLSDVVRLTRESREASTAQTSSDN